MTKTPVNARTELEPRIRCPNCDDDEAHDNLGDGEHSVCLGCGHSWAPDGHAGPDDTKGLSALAVGCTACSAAVPPEPTDWPEGCAMRLWDAEVEGATYWVAAEEITDALATLCACLSDGGILGEVESLAIESVPAKRAWRAILRSESETDPCRPCRRRMFDVVVELAAKPDAKAEVLACSEWP